MPNGLYCMICLRLELTAGSTCRFPYWSASHQPAHDPNPYGPLSSQHPSHSARPSIIVPFPACRSRNLAATTYRSSGVGDWPVTLGVAARRLHPIKTQCQQLPPKKVAKLDSCRA